MTVRSRSFYLCLNEKVFRIQYKCCIETKVSRCSPHEFAGFTVIVWLIQLSEYVSLQSRRDFIERALTS